MSDNKRKHDFFTSKSVPTETVVFKKEDQDILISIKREDLNHIYGLGNKYYKLKYNLIEAKKSGAKTLLTFGGAYSNHILATALLGKTFGFKTVGVIRGDELAEKPLNKMLQEASKNGMELLFVSRSLYRDIKTGNDIQEITDEFPNCFVIPEGGTNKLAVIGCGEILKEDDFNYDYICLAVGTGGTISGIINSSKPKQKIIGISVVNGDFLNGEIKKYTQARNWELNTNYHFGGYAKTNDDLIKFIKDFKKQTGIPLDPVYTGKVLYGIVDMKTRGTIPKESSVLAIHTGGRYGICGFSKIL